MFISIALLSGGHLFEDVHGSAQGSLHCGYLGSVAGMGLPNISLAGLGRVASSGVALIFNRARLMSLLDLRHFLMIGLM